MKKFSSIMLALVFSAMLSVPAAAEVKVPEFTVPKVEVPKDMSKKTPEEAYKSAYEEGYKKAFEEAYKKGYEDGTKSKEETIEKTDTKEKTDSKDKKKSGSQENDIIGKEIDCGDFVITITKVEVDDDVLKLTYDFTNNVETTSPWMAGVFTAFQDGIELEDVSLELDLDLFLKSVKKGGTIKNLVRAFKLDSDSKEISFEVGGFFGDKEEFEIVLE